MASDTVPITVPPRATASWTPTEPTTPAASLPLDALLRANGRGLPAPVRRMEPRKATISDGVHRNRRRSRAGRDLDDGNLKRPTGASAETGKRSKEQNGPTAPHLRPQPLGFHSPCTTVRRNSRSETLQLAAPISCPYTEAPRRRASATLSLVSRWCVVLSTQVALRHPSNRVRPAGLYAASKIHTLDFQQGSLQAPAFVAQGIEHRSPKAGVAGSNPAGGTSQKAPDRSWSGAFDIHF